MKLTVRKNNDALIQSIKQSDPRLYEALRKSESVDFTLQQVRCFGVSGEVYVGNNQFPPMILQNDVELISIITAFGTPPTGADFLADIRKQSSQCTILKDSLSFSAGYPSIKEITEFGISKFSRGDVLICDMLQIGSTYAGSMLSILLTFNLTS